MGVDVRERIRRGIGDIDYDNFFKGFCKERNGLVVGRRSGVKRGFFKRGRIIVYL